MGVFRRNAIVLGAIAVFFASVQMGNADVPSTHDILVKMEQATEPIDFSKPLDPQMESHLSGSAALEVMMTQHLLHTMKNGTLEEQNEMMHRVQNNKEEFVFFFKELERRCQMTVPELIKLHFRSMKEGVPIRELVEEGTSPEALRSILNAAEDFKVVTEFFKTHDLTEEQVTIGFEVLMWKLQHGEDLFDEDAPVLPEAFTSSEIPTPTLKGESEPMEAEE